LRVVVQRVKEAGVEVNGEIVGEIGKGFILLLGVGRDDSEADVNYLVDKILGLRVFEDENGKLNLSIKETRGEALVVSQFTLLGDCRKGRRPSFDQAAPPELAENLYTRFVENLKEKGMRVKTGKFGEIMEVHLTNSGPVTLLLDSQKQF